MQTILRFLKLAQDAKTEADIVQLTEEEANSCVEAGDLLGAGEWLTSKLDYADDQNAEVTLAKVLALWASAGELSFSPINLKDLIANIPLFDRALLAAAVGCLAARRPKVLQKQENILRDLSFRIRDDLNKVFGLQEESPAKIASLAGSRVGSAFNQVERAVAAFRAAKCISARVAAVEVAKRCRQLRPLLLVREQPMMSQIDSLLGVAFREFCQSYERTDAQKVILRLPDIQQQAHEALALKSYENSVVWLSAVVPIAAHIIELSNEASRSCKVALTPSIKLSTNLYKVDLRENSDAINLVARVINEGVGTAVRIQVEAPSAVSLLSPRPPFDLAAGSDRIIQLECSPAVQDLWRPISFWWSCKNVSGETYTFSDSIQLEQQQTQPDWPALRDRPPYSVNPVKTRDRLFGREAQLDKLLLHAAAGTSTFVWGQGSGEQWNSEPT
jgi:hypothetical protein